MNYTSIDLAVIIGNRIEYSLKDSFGPRWIIRVEIWTVCPLKLGVKPGWEIACVAISIACVAFRTRELSLFEILDCVSFRTWELSLVEI